MPNLYSERIPGRLETSLGCVVGTRILSFPWRDLFIFQRVRVRIQEPSHYVSKVTLSRGEEESTYKNPH